MNTYYPVYLELRDQPCLVVGGGKLAEEKVVGLLAVHAKVTLISAKITAHLKQLVDENQVTYIPRAYQQGDLADAFMVICATDNAELNQQVWDEASAAHKLVNVVDDIPHCNFIAPAIIRNGDLTVAISTSGRAPALAVRLKERWQKELGNEYAHFLELAGHLREPLAQHIPDFATRKKLWYEIVDSGILEVLAQGDEERAIEIISEKVGFEFQPRVKA
ncbi:MAG: bifunctional precorrin-2 dehydrogenase/sirohydrochlorin ferrochelatase [Anaerolineales bacterium]|nr:bifunctional precorrin-2 dehydrogenase/sirohydrochlorin ferrochelatase [Anaerolineales bacterium]